jgi:hypothetical protein
LGFDLGGAGERTLHFVAVSQSRRVRPQHVRGALRAAADIVAK